MTAAELDIIIGADVDQAIAAFKKLGYEIKKTEEAATKVAQKGKKDFTAFGQVLQDLPFGFIAIQNNITRLLPSAGALGLAISAITAAITFAQVGFSAWTRGFAKSKEEVDEFAKGLRSAEQGATETGVKLQAFVAIARDNTKSLSERNFALAEANKLMGEHGQKLTLVNINTAAVTEEVNKFTQALIAQAVAAKFADSIADLIIKQKDASKAYGIVLKEFNKQREEANKLEVGASASPFFQAQVTQTDVLAHKYKEVTKAADTYKAITRELQEETGTFNQTIGKSVSLLSELGIKEKEVVEKRKQFPKDKFQWLIPDFNFQVIPKLSEKMDTLQKQLQGQLNIKPLLLNIPPPILTLGEQGKAAIDATMGLINQQLVSGFAALGESLGNVLAGGKNPFAPVLAFLAEGMKTIGKAYIEIGVQMLVAKQALKLLLNSPVLTIAAGIALVALGSLLQNKANNVKAFATGGVVTKPTLALVGEQGPERITPLGYEGSANNSWMGGEVVFQISGQNLRGILRRADQTAFNTF